MARGYAVLNLIITGIPSILNNNYYTVQNNIVLNLIITGIPSIHYDRPLLEAILKKVLNLIITGIPSILEKEHVLKIK